MIYLIQEVSIETLINASTILGSLASIVSLILVIIKK